MNEFRKITYQSQKLYEDLILKQQASINELKTKLSDSSSKDLYEDIRLLNEQSEERIQSKLNYHTVFLLFSASFLSFIISYISNR